MIELRVSGKIEDAIAFISKEITTNNNVFLNFHDSTENIILCNNLGFTFRRFDSSPYIQSPIKLVKKHLSNMNLIFTSIFFDHLDDSQLNELENVISFYKLTSSFNTNVQYKSDFDLSVELKGELIPFHF